MSMPQDHNDNQAGTLIARLTPTTSIVACYKHEMISDLLHAVSHEVGNPLTSIISFSALSSKLLTAKQSTDNSPNNSTRHTSDNENELTEALNANNTFEKNLNTKLPKIIDYTQVITREAWRLHSINQDIVLFLSSRPPHRITVDLNVLIHNAISKVNKTGYINNLEIRQRPQNSLIVPRLDSEQMISFFANIARFFEKVIARRELGQAPQAEHITENSTSSKTTKWHDISSTATPQATAIIYTPHLTFEHLSHKGKPRVTATLKSQYEPAKWELLPTIFQPLIDTAPQKQLNLELATAWAIAARHDIRLCLEHHKEDNATLSVIIADFSSDID